MKKSVFIILSLLLLVLSNLSAQQIFREDVQNFGGDRGMVTPFSTQTPIDVYQQRHIQRSNISVEYHRRDNVSRPVRSNHELVTSWQYQHSDNGRVVLSNQSNGVYTQTPKDVNSVVAQNVTYNSIPTINSRGEVIAIEGEEAVIETGAVQSLPGSWGEPGLPLGDFVLPMLLLVAVYVLVRFKGLNR